MYCDTSPYTVTRGGALSELSRLQEKSSMFACKLSMSSATPSDNRPEQRNKVYENHTKPPAQTLSPVSSDTCIKTNQATTLGLPAPGEQVLRVPQHVCTFPNFSSFSSGYTGCPAPPLQDLHPVS